MAKEPKRNPDKEFTDQILAATFFKPFKDEIKRNPNLEDEVVIQPTTGPFVMFGCEGRGTQKLGVYVWMVNHWEYFDDDAGKCLAIRWLERDEYFSLSSNDLLGAQLWKYAKSKLTYSYSVLLNTKKEMNDINFAVVPTLKHYIILQNGYFKIVDPHPKYNMRFVLDIELNEKDFTVIENIGKVYLPNKNISQYNYFTDYIQDAFPEKSVEEVVQEFVGGIFFKKCFQRAIWIYGMGSNGKSTLLDLMAAISPNGGYKSANFARLGNEFSLSNLIDCSIIGVSEVEDSGRLPEDIIKQLISADDIQVNRKNQSHINIRFNAKLFVCSNNIPPFHDRSNGWYRRWIWIKINKCIQDEKQNSNLVNDIITKDFRSFLDWFLIGAMRIQNRGRFISNAELPDSLLEIKNRFQLSNNSVAQWIETVDIRMTNKDSEVNSEWTDRAVIQDMYIKFCKETIKREALGDRTFWTEIERFLQSIGEPAPDEKQLRKNGKVVKCSNLIITLLKEPKPSNNHNDSKIYKMIANECDDLEEINEAPF